MTAAVQNDVRRRILDATRKFLIEHGIENLSIRMIATEVGCSVGSIYVHFANKDVLIHDLIEEGFEKLIHLQETVAKSVIDPIERLKALCRNYLNFAVENPGYYEIMFMLKPERMLRYPAEKYRRARRNLEFISDTLAEANAETLTTVKDPYLGAHLIWAFMHGVISLGITKRVDRRIGEEKMIDSAIEQISKMSFT